jgi:hypothetical protein
MGARALHQTMPPPNPLFHPEPPPPHTLRCPAPLPSTPLLDSERYVGIRSQRPRAADQGQWESNCGDTILKSSAPKR